jgi:DNA modification methylase
MTSPYYRDDSVVIYLGNCLEIPEWLKADVLCTDPPYGISYTSTMSGKFRGKRINGDADTKVRDEALAQWAMSGVIASGGDLEAAKPALVFGSWKVPRPAGVQHVLTWEKGDHVGMGDLSMPWRPNTEEIYVMGHGQGLGEFTGHRGTSVLRYNAPSPNFTAERDRVHPNEKPLALMRALVAKCPQGTPAIPTMIADPFMGSGTTLRAAKDLGFWAVGCDDDERNCEIAAARVAQGVLELW